MSKTAFLFPGQGAQQVGMGKSIAEKFPAARALYDRASEIVGYDLAKCCFEGPAEQLNSTVVSQPAIYVTSLAALEMLKETSPEVVANCAVAAGLSLGEYTALVFAGAMSFEDGLRVVKRRGEAMQAAADATPSGMVSILMMEREQVREICDQASAVGSIRIANYLCPKNIVVSGEKAACKKALELAEAAGGKTVELTVAGAFHTDIMKPADQRLKEALDTISVRTPRLPVYSNVNAEPHGDAASIRGLLVRQALSPVLWEETLNTLLAAGVDEFYEIGPGKVLSGLLKRINRKVPCHNVNEA